MDWYDIRNPDDEQLDELARRYNLHPLHIEDCRHRDQNAKIELQDNYVFTVLKPVALDSDGAVEHCDFDIFLGPDYVITVSEGHHNALEELLQRLHNSGGRLTPHELFYRLFDGIVDLYTPVTDKLSERVEQLEQQALAAPQQSTIESLFSLRRALMELRRILANTRDILSHVLRNDNRKVDNALHPFFRDIYDHVARNLDTIEVQRDLINGATELYLSSVANQTNQVMKTLTVFGTISTPAIITGIYGMNVKHLPFAESPHSWGIVMSLIVLAVGLMLAWFRRMHLF